MRRPRAAHLYDGIRQSSNKLGSESSGKRQLEDPMMIESKRPTLPCCFREVSFPTICVSECGGR